MRREAPHVVDEGSRILAGRYEVGELIGRGGMAEVHIGYDRRLGRTVAIKILRSDLARDPSFQNRFRREAQAAAALNHPAIVAVYDTGEDVVTEPTGVVAHVPFIVMEYVEGHTVRDILRDGAAVPIDEAVEITAGVLSALEYSHRAGIVHRDIKPANVMLTPTGAVKVMDFGIARAVADSAATMTQTQAVIGTAQYLSPEQARGETVDARSDLYSTGCLLFELLTGRPPFTGDSPVAVAYQHVRENPPAPSAIASDIPEALDRVTLKALAKDREARYQTADEFRADLEAVLHGGTVNAPAVAAYGTALATVPVNANDATQVLSPAASQTQAMPPAGSLLPWAATGATGQGADAPYQDDDDDEGRRPWVIWLLLGVAVVAVVAIVLLLMHNRTPAAPTQVAVPDVVNMEATAAATTITNAKLTPVPAETADATIAKGNVVKTNPVAGTKINPNSPVTYYVSTGPADATVPNVVGQTAADATTALQNANLVVDPNQLQDDNPNYPQGQVTLTDPPANTQVTAGSTVTLSVSTGMVQLPDLTGMTQAVAMQTLDSLRLTGNPEPAPTTAPTQTVGTVISQDHPAGRVSQGTVITIQVAAAPTTAVVPDVAGLSYSDAVQRLADVGLTSVVQQNQETSAQAPGTVISTSPAANTTVGLTQKITVTVATAPTTAVVPDVTGLSYQAAVQQLANVGLTNVVQEFQETTAQAPGTVISTSPGASVTVGLNQKIAVIVAQAPAGGVPTSGAGN